MKGHKFNEASVVSENNLAVLRLESYVKPKICVTGLRNNNIGSKAEIYASTNVCKDGAQLKFAKIAL